MRYILILILFSGQLGAAPILNKNMAFGSKLTIWQDHIDNDLFYLLPSSMEMITQYPWGVERKGNVLKVAFRDIYNEKMVEVSKHAILERYPSARFKKFEFNDFFHPNTKLARDLFSSNCWHQEYPAEYSMVCHFTLTPTGQAYLIPYWRLGKLFPLSMLYQIEGVLESASGDYRAYSQQYAIPMNLGGEFLVDHLALQ
jgi:hypothetical protein